MRRPLCMLCLVFAAVLYGCIWLSAPPNAGEFGYRGRGQTIALEGQVNQKEYRIVSGEDTLVLYLNAVLLLDSGGESPTNPIQGVICYMENQKSREPQIGSRVRVLGKLMPFSKATNPGEFDMQAYYRIQRLDFRLSDTKVTGQSKGYDKFREQLYQVRRYFSVVIDNCYSEETRGIMKAMLLGEKGSLDEDTKKLYQDSGILHILAISGLHISLIGMGVYRLLRKVLLAPPLAALPSFMLIFCYALMTGISASSLRAVIMFSLHLLANSIGRTYDILTAVSIAAVLLLAEQPLYLTHTGFLFSFAAVLGIGLFLPIIKKEVPAASGISILFFTLPVHLCYYYQFPIYSVFLNLLVIPFMSFVMGSGMVVMLIGEMAAGAGRMAAWIGERILFVYEKAGAVSLLLPCSVVVTGKPTEIQVAVYCGILILIILFYKQLPILIKWQFLLVAVSFLTYQFHEGLKITMIDVGQGDGIHLETQDGRHYLIDGGSSSKQKLETYQLVPYLKAAGAGVLEAVIITHADLDHCSGVIGMLQEDTGIKIKRLILPAIGEASRKETYRMLEQLAKARHIPVHYMKRGDRIADGSMVLTSLHPKAGYETGEPNEYSLVLYLEYGGFRGLFTGDIEGVGEREMEEYLSRSPKGERTLTFLKVAHHGSGNSTELAFLNRYQPKVAFISCGEDNRYGHPHKELLSRLEKETKVIYRTDEQGALTIFTDGEKVKISTFLQVP